MFEALSEDVDAQQKALNAVAEKSTLTRLLPAAGAYALGAIPLERRDEGIVIATFPGVCAGALSALQRRLEAPILPVDFDENVMSFFIDKIYLQGHGVNIHTFRSADFLDDPTNDERVMDLKVEAPEASGDHLPEGDIVLADLHLASELHNLDRPSSPRIDSWRLGEFCPAFRRDGDSWTVWSDKPLPSAVPLLLQYSENYGGDEFFRDLSAAAVGEWPYILFPSEIQILGVSVEGALHIYVDGKIHIVRPGSTPTLSTEYWLVRHGYRFHRRITVQIRDVVKVERASLNYAPPFRGAGAEELRKWLES